MILSLRCNIFLFFNIFLMILRLKTVSGFKFNKKVNNHTDFVKKFSLAWNFQILWISQGPSFWRSLLAFDAWCWRYLSWLEVLLEFIACLRCLTLYAICRGRAHSWWSLLFLDAWLWCYLSWPEVLLQVTACLRCLTLTLYAVFQSTWLFYCLSSMLDFDAICRGRRYF